MDTKNIQLFEKQQKEFYTKAEVARFYWQTSHPYIVKKEIDLLSQLSWGGEERILEIGCGEGANIYNLIQNKTEFKDYIGIDFLESKIQFSKNLHLAKTHWVCACADTLPFKPESFNIIFLRDLLHHVDHKRIFILREALRLSRSGGKIFIIEGNGAKLTNFIFRIIFTHERGMKNSTFQKIQNQLSVFHNISIKVWMAEPSNFFRFLFHYKFGSSKLGYYSLAQKSINFINSLFSRFIPYKHWSYIVAEITKN